MPWNGNLYLFGKGGVVEIGFDDPELERTLSNEKDMVRIFGPQATKKLRIRVSHLLVAQTFNDLRPLPGRWHELSADRVGQWAVDVGHPLRLVIRPTPPVPVFDDGGIDWSRADRATIVEITDYH
jgi:toxin HigB-1